MELNGAKIAQEKKTQKSPFLRLIPSLIVVFVCSLSIPLANNLYIRIICASICTLYVLFVSAHKIASMLFILLLFGAFGFSNGLIISSTVLAMIVGLGVLAFLINHTHSPYLVIIPVLAFSISTFVTKNVLGSMLAFSFTLPAFMAARSIEKSHSRVGSICRISATTVVSFLLFVISTVIYFMGGFRVSFVREFSHDMTNSLAKVFQNLNVSLINGATESIFTETEAYNMALGIVALTPAIIILSSNVIAYFAQRIQFCLIARSDKDMVFAPSSIIFVMGPTAGILYGLTFLVSVFCDTSPTGYVISTICSNMFAIFIPGLAIMGILWYMAYSAKKRSAFRPWITVLFFLLLLFNTKAAILLLSSIGAFVSVAIPLIDYLNTKISNG